VADARLEDRSHARRRQAFVARKAHGDLSPEAQATR